VKYILYGVFCVLFSAPLMFGAVEPWSLAVMETTSFALFLFWFLRMMKTEQPNLSFIQPPFLIPIGLLFFIAVLQVIPLPPVLLKTIAPQTYRVYQDIALNGGNIPWSTLSLYPHATVLEIVRFVSYVCIYVLTLQVVRNKDSIDFMTAGVLIIGICVALTGIFQFGSPQRDAIRLGLFWHLR
jgi:hypothetical protein